MSIGGRDCKSGPPQGLSTGNKPLVCKVVLDGDGGYTLQVNRTVLATLSPDNLEELIADINTGLRESYANAHGGTTQVS